MRSKLDWMKYARPRPKRVTGPEFRKMLADFGLRARDARDFVCYYLMVGHTTYYSICWRGCNYVQYEYLRYKLTDYRIQKAMDEVTDRKYGLVREDGKRHHCPDLLAMAERKKAMKRAYTASKRMHNPFYGRPKTPEEKARAQEAQRLRDATRRIRNSTIVAPPETRQEGKS